MANGVRKSTLVRQVARAEVAYTDGEVIQAWQRSGARRLQIICRDKRYWGVPLEVWRTILQYTGVDQGQYRSERYDCDDFSLAFKAACSRKLGVNGVADVTDISGCHAFNAILIVGDEGSPVIQFLEPQNDRLIIAGHSGYPLGAGFALW